MKEIEIRLPRSLPELNSEQRRHKTHKIQELCCQTVEDTPRGPVSIPQRLFSSTKETQSLAGGFNFVSEWFVYTILFLFSFLKLFQETQFDVRVQTDSKANLKVTTVYFLLVFICRFIYLKVTHHATTRKELQRSPSATNHCCLLCTYTCRFLFELYLPS